MLSVYVKPHNRESLGCWENTEEAHETQAWEVREDSANIRHLYVCLHVFLPSFIADKTKVRKKTKLPKITFPVGDRLGFYPESLPILFIKKKGNRKRCLDLFRKISNIPSFSRLSCIHSRNCQPPRLSQMVSQYWLDHCFSFYETERQRETPRREGFSSDATISILLPVPNQAHWPKAFQKCAPVPPYPVWVGCWGLSGKLSHW